MQPILVGRDRSGNAACALRWAAELSARRGSDLVALRAWTRADVEDAKLIVVGTHGLAPVLRMRLGGVAMRLLHETSVPLILVPPYERAI